MDYCKNYPLPDWTLGFEHRKTSVLQLPYEEYIGSIDKSASDTNDYKLIRLSNNLVVMCVHDAQAKTAAAALCVNVGSNMDPVELPGLAHFLEHMMFRGTEKYPDDNEYKAYICERGGRANATTAYSKTKYYFDIANNVFEGALDRFSSFFTSPLFMKDSIDCELTAIDAEYKGLLNKDIRRLNQLERKLSDPNHPYSKFTTGNIETLKQGAKDYGLDLHEELVKFYNKYYSSDIMKLAIYGSQSLDQLVEWAVSKFSDIKSKGDSVKRDVGHPVSAEFLGKVVHFEMLDDKHKMSIIFPVDDFRATYRSDPFNYISHLVGYKGNGSILSYLKKQGWAIDLGVDSDTSQDKRFREFAITILATPDGLEHYEDILRVLFAYVRMIAHTGAQEWVHREVSSQMKFDFDSKKKSNPINQVLSYMDLIFNEYVAPEHVLSKDKLYIKYDNDAVMKYLSYINPGNFRIFIGARKHKSIDCPEIEPYFGAAYHVGSLSADLLHELSSDSIHVDDLILPGRNEFIPTDFTIKNTKLEGKEPALKSILLKRNNGFELWFRQSGQNVTANGHISLSINVPTISNSPLNYIMSIMYCALLKSKLNEDLNNAKRAKLEFKVESTSATIELRVEGFSNKLPLLLITILKAAKSFKVDGKQFLVYLAAYVKGMSNMESFTPLELCTTYMDYISNSCEWNHEIMASEMANVTLDKLQAHVDSIFDVTFTKMNMVGNFDEDEVLKVADNVQDIIKSSPYLGYRSNISRVCRFEPGYYVYPMPMPSDSCVHSAVSCNIYFDLDADIKNSTLYLILQEYINDKFHAQIRAKYQLGYKVGSSITTPGKRYTLTFNIEGESNPMYMTLHINRFIDEMHQKLIDMADEHFNDRIKAFIKLYQDQLMNEYNESELNKGLAGATTSVMEACNKRFGTLKSVTKGDLIEFWNKHVNPSTALTYTRVDVQMWSSKIWKPTISEFKNHSAKTLALYGCLCSEGMDSLDIDKVDKFITTAISRRKEKPETGNSVDILIDELKEANLSISGAMYMVGESAERAAHTGRALELAINDYVTFGNYANVSRTDFSTIGMHKTPDGLWLITDYIKFQATQQLEGLRLSDVGRDVVPKYSS